MNIDSFERDKEESLSHQVIRLGRLLNEHGLKQLRKVYKLPNLKQMHLELLPHIDFEGTCVSEIAERKGVSKQAVSKVINDLEACGFLYSTEDPNDSRSKLVFFHTKGRFAIQKGLQELIRMDKTLEEKLGSSTYNLTLRSITKLISRKEF